MIYDTIQYMISEKLKIDLRYDSHFDNYGYSAQPKMVVHRS